MSIQVRYSDKHTSISEFMYYIADRWEKKNFLTSWEAANLYEVYVGFCEHKNINFISKVAFSRVVAQYGFKTEAVWQKGEERGKGKTVRVYVVDEELLFDALKIFTRPVSISKHIGYVFIDGKKYRMTTEFELVADVRELAQTEISEQSEESV